MRPTFFIVGAPKSGTTALDTYLAEHPLIHMARPKEPHYFATDLPRYRDVSTEADYLRLFDTRGRKTLGGDASVFYLYSKDAIRLIKAFDPKAKLIAMLRNPVDIVHSFHSQLLFGGDEEIKSFAEAWNASAARKLGKRIPKHCRARELLYYDEIALLGEQLERVLSVFPREQVHLVFFEDFTADAGREYRRVLEFLGVADDGRTDFPRVNANRRHRIKFMPAIKRTISSLRAPIGLAKRALAIERIGLMDRLKAWDLVYDEREPLSVELKRSIISHYESDISLLARITNRDLSHWVEKSAAT
jgi:hypothetical protein